MANLPESATWDAGIYQLETSDIVMGGAAGVANAQSKSLANRTSYLKALLDAFAGATIPYSGYTPPSGWAFAFGQEVSCTGYPALFNATTIPVTGATTNGNATITGVSVDLTQFGIEGAKVEGAGVPAGAYVKSLTKQLHHPVGQPDGHSLWRVAAPVPARQRRRVDHLQRGGHARPQPCWTRQHGRHGRVGPDHHAQRHHDGRQRRGDGPVQHGWLGGRNGGCRSEPPGGPHHRQH